MKSALRWTTEQRTINDLIPLPDNPRTLSLEQEKQLQESLKRFDLVEIPAINTDNTILAGHQRIKVLQLLGRGEEVIDVRVPTRLLSDKETREYCIRSNKNTGSWDMDKLAEWDVDNLLSWGFNEEELTWITKHDDNPFALGNDTGEQGTYIVWQNKRIALSPEEVDSLNQRYETYLTTNGVNAGFIGELLACS